MISSSQILLYSGAGAHPFCVDALERKLNSLIDGRIYRVEKISEFMDIWRRAHSTKAVVVPGGDLIDMCNKSDLKDCAGSINSSLKKYNIGYYGVCAGALLGVSNYYSRVSCKPNAFLENTNKLTLLKLFPGICLAPLFKVNTGSNVNLCTLKIQEKEVPLYSLNIRSPGFLNAEQIPHTEILAKYTQMPEHTLFSNPENLSMAMMFRKHAPQPNSIKILGEDISETIFYQPPDCPPVLLSGSHLEIDKEIIASQLFRDTFPTENRATELVEKLAENNLESDLLLRSYFEKLQISCM